MLVDHVDKNVLQNSQCNVDWSKKPRKGQSAFEHMISKRSFMAHQKIIEPIEQISDLNWSTRSC